MLRDSMIILRKELKRTFTDRRTLFFLVVLPLVMLPAMYSVMAKMGEAKDADIASYRFSVRLYEGEGNGSAVAPFIRSLSEMNCDIRTVEHDELEDVKRSITEREMELLIVMPDHFGDSLEACATFDIAIYYNSTSDYSEYAMTRSQEALFGLTDRIVRERVIGRGVCEDVLSVFTINGSAVQYDLAPEGSVIGKVIGILLPFFILIYLFANSMKVGLDSVAGEKERGTLAIQLVNQVDRLSIVIGKMLSVMIAAIVGAASSVIGLIIASKYFISMFGGTGPAMSGYSMSTLSIVQFAIVTVPLAVLVASIVLIVSTYARNSKEGQGIIMPIYFVVMIMGVASMQTGDVAPGWMRSTPIFNSLIALRNIFMHDAAWSTILTAVLSSFVLSAVIIYLTLRMFSSEKILFRI
jgi:sodium transport system permease protein